MTTTYSDGPARFGDAWPYWIAFAAPLLASYGSGVYGVSLGDLALGAGIGLRMLERRRVSPAPRSAVGGVGVLMAALFLFTVIGVASVPAELHLVGIMSRFAKMGLYVVFCLFVLPRRGLRRSALLPLEAFALIAGCGVLVQEFVWRLTGAMLSLRVPFLPYVNADVELRDSFDFGFRPSSLFIEPAHLAMLLLLYCVVLFFGEDVQHRWLKVGFISLCGLLSTSSTFLAGLALIFALYVGRSLVQVALARPRSLRALAAGCVVLAALGSAVVVSPELREAYVRISSPDSVAVTGRLDAGDMLATGMARDALWFGTGFGNVADGVYMNGANYLLYTSGWVGVAAWLVAAVAIFRRTLVIGRVCVLLMAFLAWGSPVVISVWLVPFLSLMHIFGSDYEDVTQRPMPGVNPYPRRGQNRRLRMRHSAGGRGQLGLNRL